MNKLDLTVAILALSNDLPRLKKIVPTLSFATEILIVFDSYNRFKIPSYLKKSFIRIYFRELKNNWSKQRNFCLTRASNKWIFFLDSDELITKSFVLALVKKIELEGDNFNGFYIWRSEVFLGKKLEFGEGFVRLLRIGKKGSGVWHGNVHETWQIKGKLGKIEDRIEHYAYSKGVKSLLSKNIFYAIIRADELSRKRGASFILLIFKPVFKFIQNYFFRLGFFDGRAGFVHATGMSSYSFFVELFLWEREVKSN